VYLAYPCWVRLFCALERAGWRWQAPKQTLNGNGMGRSYWFECSKCGYRAKVSGGADRGLHFFVQTIACRDCKQLYDAVTRLRVPDESAFGLGVSTSGWRRRGQTVQRVSFPPDFQAVLNRLPYRGVRRLKWLT